MAGEVVETLIVKVEGDLSGLRKDMKGSSKVVKQGAGEMSKSAQMATRSFGNLGKSALKLAATIGIVGAAFKSIKSIFTEFGAVDALAKTADRLGITTEALVGLQFAASQTGVQSNILGTSLQRLNRRLSEVATTGGGVAKKGLDALGLTAEELLRLPLEEQFGLIGDRLNTVASVADKTAIAFGFFDTEGGKLLNTLRVGSVGLADFKKEAEDLGIAVSRVDAAKIEAANDTLSKLSQTFVGSARRMAVDLAPAIDFVAGEFVKMSKSAESASPVIDALSRGIVGGFRFAQIAVAGFRATFNAAIVGFGKLGEFATEGAIIAVKAFRRVQAGATGIGFTVIDIADGFFKAFQFMANTSTKTWAVIQSGADVAASSILVVFEEAVVAVKELASEIASAFDVTKLGLPTSFFVDVSDITETAKSLTGAVQQERDAAESGIQAAKSVLDQSIVAFKDAQTDLVSGDAPPGSELLQQMSADLVSLANSQLRASEQGDSLTESLGENLRLIREFTAEAEAGLDAAIDEGGAVGSVAAALEEFDKLRSTREAAFQAEIDQRLAHNAALAAIQSDAEKARIASQLMTAEQIDAINQKSRDAQSRLELQTNQRRLAAGQQFLSDLSTLTQSENRKAFEVGKAAAIAEAGVNTFLAATKAYQALAGIPVVGPGLGAAAAAAAIAAGVINIQKIRAMQFGGSGAGAGAAVPGQSASAGGGGGGGGGGGDGGPGGPVQTQQVNISLIGSRFSQSDIRDLLADIDEQLGDNFRLQSG